MVRQALEKSLKKNLDGRLKQISLPNSTGESIQETLPVQIPNLLPESSPRTSSPFDPNHLNHLAPGIPISPSNSFNSVFFPNSPNLPAPIHPPSPVIDILPEVEFDVSETTKPSQSFVDSIMSGLQEKETSLKTLCRKITANIEANPITILSEEEMIPLYKKTEEQLVALLVDLNVGAQEIFEDHAVELGDTKINTWKAKLQAIKGNLSQYRPALAA